MKSLFIALAAVAVASQSFAASETYYLQCSAYGNQFRVKDSPKKDYLANARFSLVVEADGTNAELKKDSIGSLEIAKFVDGAKQISLADVIANFSPVAKKSSLSEKASKYTDDKYYRFKDFEPAATGRQDGGGMSGYLVVSKKLTTAKSGEKYDAHYVLQHGDHTGGTLDLSCQPE